MNYIYLMDALYFSSLNIVKRRKFLENNISYALSN